MPHVLLPPLLAALAVLHGCAPGAPPPDGAPQGAGAAVQPASASATVQPTSAAEAADAGTAIFQESCATCHTPAGEGRTPGASLLRGLSARAVVASLESGSMRMEGEALTREQRVQVAEALTGRPYARELLPASAYCAGSGPGGGRTAGLALDLGAVLSMGFGGDLEATGFHPPARAGLDAEDIPGLELLWAFAFPDASESRTKPTVVWLADAGSGAGDASPDFPAGAGRQVLLVGGPLGEVLALDAATGCVRWSFEADAAVRGAVLAGPSAARGRPAVFFVDHRTNAYALDAATGETLWKVKVGWHGASNTTGSPALHDGRLIVPISALEVVTAGDPRYECCTASGAVAALDAATGDVLWYHRVIPGYPERAGTNSAGTQLWAPSGAPVWSSPTVDTARGLVYAGTGENYTRPATASSDAILALDIETGDLVWSFQATPDDAFTMACGSRAPHNCPEPPGPDLDFGMSPMLVERPDGKEILVAGQKSGVVWALDPDDDGALLWSARIGKGGALGGIHWGMATDGRYAYATVSDRADAVIVDVNPDRAPSPGVYALDLTNGDVVWSAPSPTEPCEGRPRCRAAHSAAPSAIAGVVFAGGLDGHIRAYDSSNGSVLWDFDTTGITDSVNGVPGRGGAIDGPGPVIAGGRLFVNSGYALFGQMPGNMLLAFGVAR